MASSSFDSIAAHLAAAQAKMASAAITIKVMERNNNELKKLGGGNTTRLTHEEQLELQQQLQLTISNYAECAQHLQASQHERDELATKLQLAENRLNGAKHNTNVAKEKLNSTTNELESTKKHLGTVKGEQKQLEQRIGSAFDEINNTKNALDTEVKAHNHTKMKLEWALTGHENVTKELQIALMNQHHLQFIIHTTQTELQTTKDDLTSARDDINIITEESNNKITREAHEELQRQHENTAKDLGVTKDELAKANARIALLISAPHLKPKKAATTTSELNSNSTSSEAKKAIATVLHDLNTTRNDAQKKISALEETVKDFKSTCDGTRTCNSCNYHLRKSLLVARRLEAKALEMVDEANIRCMKAESELQDYKLLEAKYPVLTADAHIKEQAIKAAEARRISESESSSDGSKYEEGWLEKKYKEKIKAEIEKVDKEHDRITFERYCSERESEEERARQLDSGASTTETAHEDDMAESDSGSPITVPADQAVIVHCDSDSAHSETVNDIVDSDIVTDTVTETQVEDRLPGLSASSTAISVTLSELDITEPAEHATPIPSTQDIIVATSTLLDASSIVETPIEQTVTHNSTPIMKATPKSDLAEHVPSSTETFESNEQFQLNPAATTVTAESAIDSETPAHETHLLIPIDCSQSVAASTRDSSPMKQAGTFSSPQRTRSDDEHLTNTSASTPHTSDNEGDEEDNDGDGDSHASTSSAPASDDEDEEDDESDSDSDDESLIVIIESADAIKYAANKYSRGLPKPDLLDLQVDGAATGFKRAVQPVDGAARGFMNAVHAVAKAAADAEAAEKSASEGENKAPTQPEERKKEEVEDEAKASNPPKPSSTPAPHLKALTHAKTTSPPTTPPTVPPHLRSLARAKTSSTANPPPTPKSPTASPLHDAYQARKVAVRAQEAQRETDLGGTRKARNGSGYVQATLRRHLLAGLGEPRGARKPKANDK